MENGPESSDEMTDPRRPMAAFRLIVPALSSSVYMNLIVPLGLFAMTFFIRGGAADAKANFCRSRGALEALKRPAAPDSANAALDYDKARAAYVPYGRGGRLYSRILYSSRVARLSSVQAF